MNNLKLSISKMIFKFKFHFQKWNLKNKNTFSKMKFDFQISKFNFKNEKQNSILKIQI